MSRIAKEKELRAKATTVGKSHYNGIPCARCGSKMRFVANRGCVECKRDADLKRYYWKTGRGPAPVKRGYQRKEQFGEDITNRIPEGANKRFLESLNKEKALCRITSQLSPT